LAAEVQEINPELPIILTSGYANALTSDSVNRPGIKAFLQKPIQTKRLARIVRKVLDERV